MLSRKLYEAVVIGPNREIVVHVVEIKGDRVRLAIDADRSIPIIRRELIRPGEPNPYPAPGEAQ